MEVTVNVHEAKTHLSRILDEVRDGRSYVLAKNGEPYARLVPIGPPAERELGFLDGTVPDSFFEALPDEELWG
ncbi:MAG: type II toxin-antitoxin system prevent-host-death family antitoxin [Actinomycetota bacterium]|nr:type II toxin-antitoxin system prevent-host-death family antitoxin [Actinomycetota bacterium]